MYRKDDSVNTLKIEAKLAEKYGYKKLPDDLSQKYRQFFTENIPDGLCIDGGGFLRTAKGSVICKEYRRIVVGDYGAFIEFDSVPDDTSLIVAPGQEYRVNDERYSKNVKYIWLTIDDGSGIKVYHQKKGVTYADYLPGMYYVSVHEAYPSDSSGNAIPVCPDCKNREQCLSYVGTNTVRKCPWWCYLVDHAEEMKG